MPVAKNKVYSNQEIAALADAFRKDMRTIMRWIKDSDDRLTSDKAKKALKDCK